MDERIIDFNELKTKAKDKDIDKFEQYIYSLYYSFVQGGITMADLSKKIMDYMQENNISNEKFFNIQKELMKRYGFDIENMSEEMKKLGVDLPGFQSPNSYGDARKFMSFEEKYKSRIKNGVIISYLINNEKNDLEIIIENEKVTLKSEKSIDLNDLELNEFLCSYKKVIENKPLAVYICENVRYYTY